MAERIVALIDMDCFYCQVETRLDPSLAGIPMAVVQYNAWKGGGIIAVNYEARGFGVTRNMRGDEAREKCPEIKLCKVPEVRGKADLTKYRDAGREVIEVLLTFGVVIERASVDEAYLDLTDLVEKRAAQFESGFDVEKALGNTHVGRKDLEESKKWLEGCRSEDFRLAVGAAIVEEMRLAVYKKTGFRCSAGISENKMLAKLVCAFHKPNKQTILPSDEVENLFKDLKLTKLRGLGGKLGEDIKQNLHCETVSDLRQLTFNQLKQFYDEKTSKWLQDISRGIDKEPVKERDLPKSIGCGKNFRGPEILDTIKKVESWMSNLCDELVERLKKDKESNKRVARSLNVSVSQEGKFVSRASPLNLINYEVDAITKQAMGMISKLNEGKDGSWVPRLKNISISATRFEDGAKFASSSITNFFGKTKQEVHEEKKAEASEENAEVVEEKDVIEPEKKAIVKEDIDTNCDTNNPLCDLAECEKCGKMISPFELPEHYDYHVAQELQKDLNKRNQERDLPIKRKLSTTSKGRKVEQEVKKQKNITSFFSKKC